MKNLTTLNWISEINQMEGVAAIEDYVYIYETSRVKPISFPLKIDMTVCCISLEGNMKISIDLISYSPSASGLTIIMPGQIVEHLSCSDDFTGIFIIMSKPFTEKLNLPNSFSTFLSVRNNPFITLSENQLNAMKLYCTMLQNALNAKANPNRIEIATHLTIAFFYGIGYYFHTPIEDEKVSRNEVLVKSFIKQIQRHYKTERKVEFYADKLCLSPKYLSQVIKDGSGKTASDWIDEYVVVEAKALLKSTDMTIQQISDELNFPTQSFFGKYFKRLTGISPKQYRDTI